MILRRDAARLVPAFGGCGSGEAHHPAPAATTGSRKLQFKAMLMRRATGLAAILLLATTGCGPVVPYHPPPHTGHPATTIRGDGHGSTMPSADQTRTGGIYPSQGGRALDHQQHGLDRGSQFYGGAGYGTGAYGPIR